MCFEVVGEEFYLNSKYSYCASYLSFLTDDTPLQEDTRLKNSWFLQLKEDIRRIAHVISIGLRLNLLKGCTCAVNPSMAPA